MPDFPLPNGIPAPTDDGAADHLPGAAMPSLALPGTDGSTVDLAAGSRAGRIVVYAYPMTGRPGVPLPRGWDAIPGARGCTPQSCGFRDHLADLRSAGARGVYGLSSQSTDYQREAAQRLHLPFALLSDPGFALAEALGLPTFTAPEVGRLYTRLTMIIRGGMVEHVFYPVFPPDSHAQDVVAWVRRNPVTG